MLSIQLCAGQQCAKEVAVHVMHDISEADDTDGIVLFNAFDAFEKWT